MCFALCIAFVFGVVQDHVNSSHAGGRRRASLSCKSLFSVKPFAGAVLQLLVCSLSPLSCKLYPCKGLSKDPALPCFLRSHPCFLTFHPFALLPPLRSVQTWAGGCRLPSRRLPGLAGLMVKLNFTAVFKLIESSAWVTGNSGIIMYLIWVFKSAFAAKSRALDLGGSDG